MKKTLSAVILTLALIVTYVPIQTHAYGGEEISYDSIGDVDGNFEIVPFRNIRVIDDEPITQSGAFWDQTYDSYRIWVQNDTNETMTVTIRYPEWWGLSSGTRTMTVPAGKGKSYTNNSAHHGEHKVSFSTPSGYLSGTVSVRISEEKLE